MERQRDRSLFVEVHLLVGGIALHHGNLVTARAHLEQSWELSAAKQPSTSHFVGGSHPTIITLAWIPQALWGLGYADQAQQRSREALALAQHVGHTLRLAYAKYHAAMHSQSRQDVMATQACAES
jgi:hypothetical protein